MASHDPANGRHDEHIIGIGQMFPSIVELNVGGVFYTTALSTLTRDPDSLLGRMFSGKCKHPVLRDSKGKFFIDRDGVLFRYILDYLRNSRLVLPENFSERDRLQNEAIYFHLHDMAAKLHDPTKLEPSKKPPGTLVVGYRGTFTAARDGLSDVRFRKLARILVSGKITLCREVFADSLNESRDPDRGAVDRYTSRFFLKHTALEQAFDMLCDAGYKLAGCCASGASGVLDKKPGMDFEEERWYHYNEFIWTRL